MKRQIWRLAPILRRFCVCRSTICVKSRSQVSIWTLMSSRHRRKQAVWAAKSIVLTVFRRLRSIMTVLCLSATLIWTLRGTRTPMKTVNRPVLRCRMWSQSVRTTVKSCQFVVITARKTKTRRKSSILCTISSFRASAFTVWALFTPLAGCHGPPRRH